MFEPRGFRPELTTLLAHPDVDRAPPCHVVDHSNGRTWLAVGYRAIDAGVQRRGRQRKRQEDSGVSVKHLRETYDVTRGTGSR